MLLVASLPVLDPALHVELTFILLALCQGDCFLVPRELAELFFVCGKSVRQPKVADSGVWMAPMGDVVDISSDEEDLFMDTSLNILFEPPDLDSVKLSQVMDDICGVADYATREDIDDLMIMSEISAPPVLQKTAEPDELVVMGELSSPPALQQKKPSADGGCDEDDDDCVVLDGDPDKAVTVADEGSVGDGSSDVQIVAEKGPVFHLFHSDL